MSTSDLLSKLLASSSFSQGQQNGALPISNLNGMLSMNEVMNSLKIAFEQFFGSKFLIYALITVVAGISFAFVTCYLCYACSRFAKRLAKRNKKLKEFKKAKSKNKNSKQKQSFENFYTDLKWWILFFILNFYAPVFMIIEWISKKNKFFLFLLLFYKNHF